MESKVDVRSLPITLQVGKQGITLSLIQELDRQLGKRKVVKVKFLRSFLESTDKGEAVQMLAKETQSTLLSFSGFKAVFYRAKNSSKPL